MSAPFLEGLTLPDDLRRLSGEQLKRVTSELRDVIIETCLQNGGHIGASLGTVELAVALHTVVQSPRDKIVWDVGHQAYAHKLLTGRLHEFHTLRKEGGLSGFLRRQESEHDAFGAGHASTSISAALGYAVARDRLGERHNVVAVIGDGALTGGMAFEALNNAGQLQSDLVVILNDNEMSIAPNVGAISHYLSRLRMDSTLKPLRDELERAVRRLPGIGGTAGRMADSLKDNIKHLFVPGRLFEEMGFAYFGPLDGHDVPLLQRALKDALRRRGPVLLHVHTEKGRGYPPAATDPEKMHATSPVRGGSRGGSPQAPGKVAAQSASTPSTPAKPKYSDLFADTLVEFARADERIVAITAAMPGGTGLNRFAPHFPERFYDVGIAEQHAVTFAAGLACGGMKPVAAIYSTFLQRALDQIIHDVALQRLPVTFCLDRAGLVGDDGPTHHGVFDLTYLRMVPNMVVMAPRDENMLRRMLKTAIDHDGPAAVRYPRGKGLGVQLDAEPERLPIGRGERLRAGVDATVVAVGSMVEPSLQAAELLAKEGYEVGVIDARFVKPLDRELLLETARETGVLLTVEEGVRTGGFGSGVLEMLADAGLLPSVRVGVLGVPDEFVEHGSPGALRAESGLDATGIARALERLLAGAVSEALPGVSGMAAGGD